MFNYFFYDLSVELDFYFFIFWNLRLANVYRSFFLFEKFSSLFIFQQTSLKIKRDLFLINIDFVEMFKIKHVT